MHKMTGIEKIIIGIILLMVPITLVFYMMLFQSIGEAFPIMDKWLDKKIEKIKE